MKAYCFFSIHDEVFHRIATRLAALGVESVGGFVWSTFQAKRLVGRGIDYEPLVVFTRDMLPLANNGASPDLAWLARRERELGVSIERMLAAERHLLAGRSYERIMRLAEVVLRQVAEIYDSFKPDFVYTEDISCLLSYAHFVIARERGMPFWCFSSGRLPNRITVYSQGFQRSGRIEALYHETIARGLTAAEREEAETYVAKFRDRPAKPPGMAERAAKPGLGRVEATRWVAASRRYLADPDDPTATPPVKVVWQRLRRLGRIALAERKQLFQQPVVGDQYILYPIHFQPEASTLVQAPMYLDQVELVRDLAKSLPAGLRLYVKEHVSNRGRRPIEFYEQLRAIPEVRLLGPDVDTWSLIQNARAIAVITGTMGWEALLFDKPVISFGDVFFNSLPHVYRADLTPKDGWHALLVRALTQYEPDREALLAFVSALQRGTYEGFFGNADVFPQVLDENNLDKLTHALACEVGLTRAAVRHRAG